MNIINFGSKYKILWKLGLLVLAMFFLITLLSLITIYNITLLDKNADIISSYNETLKLVESLQIKSNDLLNNEKAKEIMFDQNLVEKYKDFDNYIEQFMAQAKKAVSNRDLKKTLSRLNSSRENFNSLLKTTYQAYDDEFDVWDTAEIPMTKLISKREGLHKDIEELLIKNNALINSMTVNSSKESRIIVSYMIAIVCVIFICLMWFSYYLTRRVTFPINRLIIAAREIGAGNLDYKIDLKGYDEIGELGHTLNQMTDSLKESNERLKSMLQLAVTVAHEVRNPIAGIGNAVQVISSKFPKEDPYREIINEMTGQINRVDEIISNLLNYARPVPLNLAKCRIRETLLNIINFVKTSGSPDSITETIDMPQETDPVLNIDIKQFTQVFMNVVINAYQALSGVAGAEIKIRTFIESKKMMIEVIDNGPGVAAEIAHKIFEPFFTTKHKGSGLGLAVSQKIVRSMNGDITVSSVPGKETKFTIMLPVCEDAG
ncbi:MAG: Sensor protein ZraS [bacterium ADurb.Bin243]|nr:MAG: Sensor protein ZraS [bacterium ADurb.Bin243]HOD41340.1 ATP-binding protein [Candidatus Wallbacteria bacterium]